MPYRSNAYKHERSELMPENIHSGHRKRMRSRFDKVNFEGWSEHEVLEYLLFFVYRRSDTNALAHRLIDRFGSLEGIFEATQQELCKVKGVGEQAAYFMRAVGSAIKYIETNRTPEVRINKANIGKYLSGIFASKKRECFYLILLDKNMHVITNVEMSHGDFEHTDIDISEIINIAVKHEAAVAIAAHNHPSGVLAPSEADITTTRIISEALALVNSRLYEHYIFSGGEYTGIIEFMNKKKKH